MKYEPVAILDTIKAVIVGLTIVGVWQFDTTTTDWIVGAVGAVLALITTFVTRRSVYAPATVAKIRTESGA